MSSLFANIAAFVTATAKSLCGVRLQSTQTQVKQFNSGKVFVYFAMNRRQHIKDWSGTVLIRVVTTMQMPNTV